MFCDLVSVRGRYFIVGALLVASTSGPVFAQRKNSVVVHPPHIKTDWPHASDLELRRAVDNGLTATGFHVLRGDVVKRALRGAKSCGRACLRDVAVKTQARYVVGGRIEGKERFFRLNFWLADGYSGRIIAESASTCNICVLEDMKEKVELAASALRAKLQSQIKSPGHFKIVSNPPGATILVGHDVYGVTPGALNLPSGKHQLTIKLAGHLPQTREVVSVSGINETVRFDLLSTAGGGLPYAESLWRLEVGCWRGGASRAHRGHCVVDSRWATK